MTSHRSLVWPGCVRKLKLVLSGLDAGKFLIVQLPSIWICEGGNRVDKAIEHAAEIGDAIFRLRRERRSAATLRRRTAGFRSSCSPRLTLFVLARSHVRPRSITRRIRRRRDRGSPRCGLDSGGPAVIGPQSMGPLDR